MVFQTIGSSGMWIGFLSFVFMMLAIDLGVFNRKAHAISMKEAAAWSGVWISLAVVFNYLIYLLFGPQSALEFATGYLIEKALAVDNIFVFVVIFGAFAVPKQSQHRVLYWGVLGALVMRAGFILAGGAFLQRFHWAMYVFGAILVLTGVKLLRNREVHIDPTQNVMVKLVRRFFPVRDRIEGERFFLMQDGRLFVTPLFLALVAVEVSDLIFAVDSIPAIFAVTSDPFIVFTSNIFAILGLRSLYFLLAGIIDKFHYLNVGLSFVLMFVGTKMLLMDLYKIPVLVSLFIIASLLAGSIVASLLTPAPVKEATTPQTSEAV